MLFNAFILAIRAIWRNKMRSFLTTLGIVIGIASVIILVTIGNGATASITDSIGKLGSNMLTVSPGQQAHGPARGTTAALFDSEDLRAIKKELLNAKAVTPLVSQGIMAVYGGQDHVTTLYGSDNDYFIVRAWKVQKGRDFSPIELKSGKAVCIIGTTIEHELFESQDALGAKLRLKNINCTVIGILEDKGGSSFGQDQDDMIVMPLRTFQRRISGSLDISAMLISVEDGADSKPVISQIEGILRERRHISKGEEDDFNVRDLKEIIETVSKTTNVLTLLLGAVAAISLLVGGIGIMNIMLVSVTERTREIGIRLAIGAFEREVLMQFLVESIVLSSLGGVIGVILGVVGAYVGTLAFEIPFIVDVKVVFLAFSFSTVVGIVFGYFPARKAAHLDPIDALRHE